MDPNQPSTSKYSAAGATMVDVEHGMKTIAESLSDDELHPLPTSPARSYRPRASLLNSGHMSAGHILLTDESNNRAATSTQNDLDRNICLFTSCLFLFGLSLFVLGLVLLEHSILSLVLIVIGSFSLLSTFIYLITYVCMIGFQKLKNKSELRQAREQFSNIENPSGPQSMISTTNDQRLLLRVDNFDIHKQENEEAREDTKKASPKEDGGQGSSAAEQTKRKDKYKASNKVLYKSFPALKNGNMNGSQMDLIENEYENEHTLFTVDIVCDNLQQQQQQQRQQMEMKRENGDKGEGSRDNDDDKVVAPNHGSRRHRSPAESVVVVHFNKHDEHIVTTRC